MLWCHSICPWHHQQSFITWLKLYCRCGHVTQVFYEINYHNLPFIRIWPEKPVFLKSGFWFKFNNLGLGLGMNLKFCTSVAKTLKVKVRTFWELTVRFVEGTGKKLVLGHFAKKCLRMRCFTVISYKF